MAGWSPMRQAPVVLLAQGAALAVAARAEPIAHSQVMVERPGQNSGGTRPKSCDHFSQPCPGWPGPPTESTVGTPARCLSPAPHRQPGSSPNAEIERFGPQRRPALTLRWMLQGFHPPATRRRAGGLSVRPGSASTRRNRFAMPFLRKVSAEETLRLKPTGPPRPKATRAHSSLGKQQCFACQPWHCAASPDQQARLDGRGSTTEICAEADTEPGDRCRP